MTALWTPTGGVDESGVPRDEYGSLTLLTSSIAGRPVPVSGGPVDRAFTDGVRIVVPASARDGAADPAVVQACLLRLGSLTPGVVARLGRSPGVRARFLTLEAARAVDSLGDRLPRRLTRRIRALYEAPVTAGPRDSLDRARRSAREVPEAPEWLGTIRPMTLLVHSRVVSESEPVEEQDEAGARDEPEDPDEDSERSTVLEKLGGGGGDNALSRLLRSLLGTSTGRDDTDSHSGEEIPVGPRTRRRARALGGPGGSSARPAAAGTAEPVGHRYPEWDRDAGRYRPAWCTVAEYDPAPVECEIDLDHRRDDRLLAEVARLGVVPERHRRLADGDALDVTALIDFALDRRTGSTTEPRVYEMRRPTGHDLGVLVLLDASGSTGESDDDGVSVFEAQREVAARLTSAFTEVGDRTACYGFRSWGRGATQFLRVKDFSSPFDRAAHRRLVRLEAAGFTRLGAAVRHGSHLLTTAAGTAGTLLVVVGDGLPYDDGYENSYAQEDCRRAFREAVAVGVGCACVSVRTSTRPEVIDHVWGHVAHRELDRPEALADEVAPMFRHALKEAAASRRLLS